jgi:uncharacterized RDD family membrane protein YckC
MQENKICEDCGTKVPAGTAACPNCGLSFAAQKEWEERVDHEIGGAFPLPPEEARHGKAEELPEQSRRHLRPAGFWLRFVALFVDGILLQVLNYGLMAALGIAMGFGGTIESPDAPYAFLVVAVSVSFILPTAYFVLMEASGMQATLGKKLVGLKVTDLDGRRLSIGRSAGRTFAKILSGITLYVGFMMAGWTQKKQGLHDMVASTLVIRQ